MGQRMVYRGHTGDSLRGKNTENGDLVGRMLICKSAPRRGVLVCGNKSSVEV